MANDIEGQVKDYRNRKKRYRRRMMFIFVTILLIIAIIGALYIYRRYNKSYQKYKSLNTFAIKGDQIIGYLPYGENIIRYNKDGVQAINKSGKVLWNGAYEMSDPIADTCGNYVMIADRGNKLIHIYNEKGEDKSINTLYNIVKAKVASQGVVAALMEEDDNSYIKYYYSDDSVVSADDEDDVLVDMKFNVDTEGYPIDIALSGDAKKLVAVYMTVNTGELICNIGCWNFGEVGKNNIKNGVGGYKSKPGIIVSGVSFLNNDTFCAFKENGFALYSMVEKPKLINEITLSKKIESIFHNDQYTGLVLEQTEKGSKQLMVYNLNGDEILNKSINFDYDKIGIFDDEIIMHDDTSCVIMKVTGKEKFRHTFDENIMELYPINHLDRYYLAGDKKISQILLSE